MHFARRGHIVEQHIVAMAEALMQGLAPEARPIGQIWTCILWQRSHQRGRIDAGEAEPNNAAPVVRNLREFDAHAFVHLDWPCAERDALAEAFVAAGDLAVARYPNVVTVHIVEGQWRQIVGSRTRGGRSGGCNKETHTLIYSKCGAHWTETRSIDPDIRLQQSNTRFNTLGELNNEIHTRET